MIYLDNAAATPVPPQIQDFLQRAIKVYYANPESAHQAGQQARRQLASAAEELLSVLGGPQNFRLNWTASATDAMRMVMGFPAFHNGNIVTTAMEHPALRSAVQQTGCEIRNLRIQPEGQIDLDHLAECLDEGTCLIAIHHIQNETGIIQDLLAVREVMMGNANKAILLVDTVQSIGKIPVPWASAEIDIAFIAGHKLGSPAGAAVIYRHERLRQLDKFLSDTRGKDHAVGRPDPAIALTLNAAVKQARKEWEEVFGQVRELNQQFRTGLTKISFPGETVPILLPADKASPFILGFRLPLYQGEVLVRMLAERDIMISAGSACEASSKSPSPAWTAMGVAKREAYSALRVSFWRQNTAADVELLLQALQEVVEKY